MSPIDSVVTAASAAPDAAALALRNVTKRYGPVTALDDMSFEVGRHEVVGLVGENGAGKSTLLKVLMGLVTPDLGGIERFGVPVRFRGVTAAARAGVAMVYQEQSLVPNLSVAENILLGAEGAGVRGGVYRWGRLRRLAAEQLERIGSDISPSARVDSLTFAQRQMVEIAKALAVQERCGVEPVILLDEPTSVLERNELGQLFAQIARLRTEGSVVFVSHRIEEVMEVADRIYVLRNGAAVAERTPAETTADELRSLMIGRDGTGSHYHEELQVPAGSEVRLAAERLTVDGCFRDVSFEVRAGEVVALAGVQGSGREEICRAVFGAVALDSGRVLLDGRPVTFASPRGAVRRGIGYVPAERRAEGMVATMSVAANLSMSHVSYVCRGPLLDRAKERATAAEWVERLSVRTPSVDTPIGRLSGGNQQKVVLARWLMAGTVEVLVLDHPTRGLDVGAKSDVYKLIRELAARGVAVLLLADSLDETIALCHRLIVMRDGEITAELAAPAGQKPTAADVIGAMV